MIVSDFIEWLKTQDQGATVQVVVAEAPTGHDAYGRARLQDFDPRADSHTYYTDLRGNKFVSENEPDFGRRFLELGGPS